jgi:nucleoid-associated protein EbfC
MSDDSFKLPDLGGLMQAAQKLQGDFAKMQEELERRTVEASAGGGMVTVVVNGRYEIVSLKVEKQVVDPEDVGMLQDLIVAAVNQGLAKIRDMTKQEMTKLGGGLGLNINLPGLGG